MNSIKIYILWGSLIFTNVVFSHTPSFSQQTTDTLSPKPDKLSMLVYGRCIVNAKGKWRTDQNIVTNFKSTNWLRIELGLRLGERPNAPNAYFHYKVELQSIWFHNIARVIGRLSDNLIYYPLPNYRKTNELIVAEAKYPFLKSFHIFAGGGYVFSALQYNSQDALPTNKGTKNNYPVYKVALKYAYNNNGDIELIYGSYDVFNPYMYNQPFTQLGASYELTTYCKLQGYFRYQYNRSFTVPNNYFVSVGAKFNIL